MGAEKRGGVDLLALVCKRRDVLWALSEGKGTKPELVAALDVSRSTVDRALRELVATPVVDRVDGEYVVTASGAALLESFEACLADFAAVSRVEDVVDHLPPDAPISTAFLRDASVTRAPAPAPTRGLDPFRTLLDRASGLRAASGYIVDDHSVEMIRDRVVEEGLYFELVVTEEVLEYLVTQHSAALACFVDSPGGVYEVESLPFNLVVGETETGPEAQLFVYDERGEFAGILTSDSPAAVEWGEKTYRRCRERATAVD